VRALRVSPWSSGCVEALAPIRSALDRALSPGEAASELESLLPAGPCNGYWHGKPGRVHVAA